MEIIKMKDECYEMTEEQYFTIQDAMCSISNLIEIMNGYCENNFENIKEIGPLLTIISQIKVEGRRITGLF